MADPEFNELMKAGVGRVYEGLEHDMPLIARNVQSWMKALAGTDEPADYFLHPVAFPWMLAPWWLERQLNGQATPDFQSDLIFATASLYYYIRLVDNVMDGDATVEYKLLPAAGYFVEQFHDVYHKYFDVGHPFWDYFRRTWSEFCDVTAADGHLTDIDRQTFVNVVSHKVGAARIGLAAVCFQYQRADLIPQWDEWIHLFGCWHLFREDLLDWQQDLKLGTATYFLCEAARRRRPGELEVSWMAREGLDWGIKQLDTWMQQVQKMTFVSPEVVAYLGNRQQEFMERLKTIGPALEFIRQLTGTKSNG